MELIRRWASESWTDHNVHDPGITILEACSYAMTELGLRLQLDVGRSAAQRRIERGRRPRARASRPARGPGESPGSAQRAARPSARQRRADLSARGQRSAVLRARGRQSAADLHARHAADPAGRALRSAGRARRPRTEQQHLFVARSRRAGRTTTSISRCRSGTSPEAAPFRQGAAVNTVAMVLDGGEVWRALPEAQSYFGRLDVGYTGPPGRTTSSPGCCSRSRRCCRSPVAVLPGILGAARTAVESTAPSAPVVRFADAGAPRRCRGQSAADLSRGLAQSRRAGGANRRGARPGNRGARAHRGHRRHRRGAAPGRHFRRPGPDALAARALRVAVEPARARSPIPTASTTARCCATAFWRRTPLAAAHPSVLFLSDVLRLIMRRRSATRVGRRDPGESGRPRHRRRDRPRADAISSTTGRLRPTPKTACTWSKSSGIGRA